MLIYVLDILLVLLQVFGIQGSEQYFKSEKKITWRQAMEECNMVTDLDINITKIVVDTGHNFEVDDDVWVGFYMMKTGFDYIGCAENPERGRNFIILQNTPGLCYTACSRTDFIGVSGNKCFCLNKKPERIDHNCSRSCPSDDRISCEGDKHQAIYRCNKAVLGEASQTSGDCLSFQHYFGKRIFKWEPCSVYHPPLCMQGNKTNVLTEHNGWYTSVQRCLASSLRPSYYTDLVITNDRIDPSWSGIIRSDAVYSYKDFRDSYLDIRYGYLTKETIQTILKFTTEGKEETYKFALCKNKQIHDQAGDDKTSANEGVAVGVSVAVVLIVIAVISTVVVLKRRQKSPTVCLVIPKAKASAYTDSDNTTTRKPNVNSAFDNHGYSVASKKSNSGDEHQTGNSNQAPIYFEFDQPVNVAGPVTNTNIENESDYNEITIDINATYDHAYNNKKNGEQTSEDTYDTTEKAAIKLKEIAENNPDNFDDTGEDDYNHISGQPLKSSKTDNVYGVPKQHKSFAEDAGKSLDKDVHDAEDAYNHIHNKPQKSSGTDNLYGLSSS